MKPVRCNLNMYIKILTLNNCSIIWSGIPLSKLYYELFNSAILFGTQILTFPVDNFNLANKN